MKKNKILTIICLLMLVFGVGFKNQSELPKDVYKVYLEGETVGYIEDKDDLLKLINNKQKSIKKKYGVDKVYPPHGLKMVKYTTYSKNLKSADEVYRLLVKKSKFTVKGYVVSIKNDKKVKYIKILNKSDLKPALKSAASAFIPKEKMQSFIDETQTEVTDTGTTIENIYFQEKITIKEDYLNANDLIITNKNDLTKYLLFGTLEKQADYVVKDGDTVETVAYNNKLSNEELLIANPKLTSVNSLLSEGQVLNIGLINPMFTVVEEAEVIEDIPSAFETIEENDDTKAPSESYVKQEGVNGTNRVTEKVLYKNGQIMNLVVSNTKELTKPTPKIFVKGTKKTVTWAGGEGVPATISGTNWGWPTISPYIITSRYGYRWGKLHAGIDISGSGFGSPIYSATDGVVYEVESSCASNGYYGSRCGGGYGNVIKVRATNGYTIYYGHLTNNVKVRVGQTVSKGDHIGFMGNSGSSTGTHLHYQINAPSGGAVNPCAGPYSC